MLKRILVFIYLFLLVLLAQSQTPTPPVIRYLLVSQKEITYIFCSTKHLLPESSLPRQLRYEAQYLYKTQKGLFLGLQGTGRLYHLRDSSGYLQFTRIDSTFFSGANFNAIPFVLNGEIYSLGGYGFWRRNGLLRRYNPVMCEWNVQNVAQEIPVLNDDFLWIDEKRQLLYVHSPTIQIQGLVIDSLERDRFRDRLLCLDIRTGKWEEKGMFRKSAYNLSLPSPWGVFWISGPNDFQLWDIEGNRFLKATDSLNDRLHDIFSQPQPDILFFIDSVLYFGSNVTAQFDSVSLSRDDFAYAGPLLWESGIVTNVNGRVAWGAGVLLLGLFFFLFRGKIIRSLPFTIAKRPIPARDQKREGGEEIDFDKLFDPMERQLIELKCKNTQQGQYTSIEAINHLLGLTSKNEAVQKKNRNDMLNTINQKWAIQSKSAIPLITRTRSDTDKRVYLYSIHPYWLPVISKSERD